MGGGGLRIDLHAHEMPERYLREAARLIEEKVFPVPAERVSPWRLEEHLALMEATGIDRMVLSMPMHRYLADRSRAVELARMVNEVFVEVARKHPDRFDVFCCVPLAHVEDAVAELHRCVGDLGCRGVIVGTTVLGRPLTHPEFLPFFAAVNRLRLPVLLHPMDPGGPASFYDFRLDLWVGWPFETTLAVSRMVLSGLFDRFADFPLILSHLGGTVPQALDRIRVAAGNGRAAKPVEEYFKAFYYDTAGPVPPEAVRCAVELFGVDRIVFGTDHPFGPGRGKPFIERAIECVEGLRVDPAAKAMVYGGTAARLLAQVDPEAARRAP